MNIPARAASLTNACLLALLLVACDSGDSPEPTTPGISPTSATAQATEEPNTTPTPTQPALDIDPPTRPAEMSVDDVDGAAAAVWYFLRAYEYMMNTGDTRHFEGVSLSTCIWCARAVEIVDEVYDEGGWFEGVEFVFDTRDSRVSLPSDSQDYYVVRLDVTISEHEVVGRDGTRDVGPETLLSGLMAGVRYTGNSFVVVGANYADH